MIFARDSWRCVYCGNYGELKLEENNRPRRLLLSLKDVNGFDYQIDHINPVAKNGDNSFLNLVTSCRECNILKSSKIVKPLFYSFKVKMQ